MTSLNIFNPETEQSELRHEFRAVSLTAADVDRCLVRQFSTGATRNTDTEKHDLEGFLSPLVLEEYAAYMHKHRRQSDGKLRDSDNWQKGIPLPEFMKSLWRHFLDFWSLHRGYRRFCPDDGHELTIREAGCSILFNVMGYIHETVKAEESSKN